MTKEEVKISVGVDSSQVGRDLSDVRKQFTAFQKDLKHQAKGLKEAFTFFGAGGVVLGVVEALRPATEAASELFGKIAGGGTIANDVFTSLTDKLYSITIGMRKAREENEKLNKELKDLAAGNDESKRNNRLDELEPLERVNALQKQLNDAMIEENSLIGTGVEFEIEKQKRLAKGLKLHKEYADALKALDADRKQKAQEQKQRDKEEIDALQKKKDLQDKLVDLGNKANDARADIKKDTQNLNAKKNQDYIPSIDQVANSNSMFAGQARDLLDAQAYARDQVLNYGVDKQSQQAIDYAESLKKPLEKAGLLGPQETIAEATKASSKTLEGILKEQEKTTKLLQGDGDTK